MKMKILVLGLCLSAAAVFAFLAVKTPGKTDPPAQEIRKQSRKPNRLITEKSPYLLSHAYDPVDWNPWGEEAFERARNSNSPVFLSIGYASCFACYSMQREVFEDPKVAGLMNRYAVNILVDREERPEIDRIYMSFMQTMSGSGGWPMSLFLTADRKPFFGATYLSAPVFSHMLARLHEVWLNEPERLVNSGDLFASYLEELARGERQKKIAGANALRKGFEAFRQLYDAQFGGFGPAPKYPHPLVLGYLLRYSFHMKDAQALDMVLYTLRRMADGAIFDQLGYGFHRFSADAQWRTPHFEKMLYDQALLAVVYLEAYQMTRSEQYSQVAERILAFVQNELASSEGAYYGAIDSASTRNDSHPEEKEAGAFYVWTAAEIDRLLGESDSAVFQFLFGVRPEGNALDDPFNALANRNVLFRSHTDREAATRFHKTPEEIRTQLSRALRTLRDARRQRPAPKVDDKIILSWNALMISAFARASAVLENRTYLAYAIRCNDFLDRKLSNSDGRGMLVRRYRDGEARYEGNLQDYAFYVQALLDLYEASFDIRYLQRAIAITDQMLDRFEDQENGGLFDTAADEKLLPVRAREFYDDAEPAGNGVAILDLLRLFQFTDRDRYRKAADRAIRFFSSRMLEQPEAMPQFLVALEFSLQKPKQIVIAGEFGDAGTQDLLRAVHSRFLPDKVLLLANSEEDRQVLSSYLPFVAGIQKVHGKPAAYICENYACKAPSTDPQTVAALLEERP